MNSTFTSLEFPDVNALNVLIDNWDDLPLTPEQRKPIKIQDNEYQLLSLLKKYKKSITGDFATINYAYSKNHLISGRQFAKDISLQGMKRWVRHTLSKDYYDYDIVNCHPTIFLQYCQKKKWNTTAFERYNQNRDAYLLELMTTNNITRDDAKEIVLSLLNGGTKNFNSLDFKPEWLTLYHKALTDTHKKFLTDPENYELVKHIKSYKERNIAGSVMNHILCNIENDVLSKAIEYLKAKYPTLIFDGFQSKDFFNSEKLNELQNHILQETGYDLKWIEKPMNEGIDLSGFSVNKPEDPEPPTEEITPLIMLDRLMTKESDYLKNINDTIYVFNKKTGMWVKEGLGIFMNMCADAFGRENIYGGSPRHIKEIFTMCKTLDDATDWFIEARRNRLGKLLYSNGVLNIETGEFEEFNCNYFFTKRIPRPFNKIINQEHYNLVFQTLFLGPHKQEIAMEFLKAISLAMTGKNPNEASYDNLGTGSNGKTLMMEALLEAFPSYVDPFPITAFRVNGNASANAHSDMKVKMGDIRIGLSSEGAAGMITDSEEFKRMTSQEQFYARECGEKMVKIKPEMTLFTFSQNPLVFDKIDKAVMRRRFGFPWNKTFEKAKDGALDFLKTKDTYEALDHIILYGYQLWKQEKFLAIEELSLFKEELDAEQDIFSEILEETFEIVIGDKTDKDNWTKSIEVYKYFKRMSTSEYTIKKKFAELGIICKKARGNEGNTMYFQGILKKINCS